PLLRLSLPGAGLLASFGTGSFRNIIVIASNVS
ncbi:unnamed protein product, partial [marine sediment metagenome]